MKILEKSWKMEKLGKWKVNPKVMQRVNSVVGREDDPMQAHGFDCSALSAWHILACLFGEGPLITGVFPVEINDSPAFWNGHRLGGEVEVRKGDVLEPEGLTSSLGAAMW